MPRIVLARDRQHEQVEFPEGVPKSESRRGGSLHLRRGIVRDVTKEELDYIEVKRPDLFACIDVMPEPMVSKLTLKRQKAQKADKVKSRRALLKEKGEADKTKEGKAKPEEVKPAAPTEPESKTDETKTEEKSEDQSSRFATSRSSGGRKRGGS